MLGVKEPYLQRLTYVSFMLDERLLTFARGGVLNQRHLRTISG